MQIPKSAVFKKVKTLSILFSSCAVNLCTPNAILQSAVYSVLVSLGYLMEMRNVRYPRLSDSDSVSGDSLRLVGLILNSRWTVIKRISCISLHSYLITVSSNLQMFFAADSRWYWNFTKSYCLIEPSINQSPFWWDHTDPGKTVFFPSSFSTPQTLTSVHPHF